MEEFIDFLNEWDPSGYGLFVGSFKNTPVQARALKWQMDRHGYTTESLVEASSISKLCLENYLNGDLHALSEKDLSLVAGLIGMDYRVLLPHNVSRDPLGKCHYSVDDSVKSIRKYNGYQIASMSSSPAHPDLSGVFMSVHSNEDIQKDLYFFGNTHYLVTGGEINFHSFDARNQPVSIELRPDDSLWVSPFKIHSFSGIGGLIKMSNGEKNNYLNLLELSNCFNLPDTLLRSHHDGKSWN